MRRYADPRLLLFIVLAALASVISAHGAWVFFGYLVAPELAAVFTAVLALGIVGLDAAATLETHPSKRAAYIGGMVLFLVMEVLANYFAGQASFVSKVQKALAASAPGADLLTITALYPGLTRALVVLFLSLASIAVAAFVFAAANRVAQIRRGLTAVLVMRLRSMLMRRRIKYAVLAEQFRRLRSEAESRAVELATERAASASFRERSARLAGILRSRRALVRRLVANVRSARNENERLSADLRTIAADAARADAELLAKSAAWAEQSADVADRLRMSEAQSAERAEQLRTEREQAARLSDQVRTAQAEAERLRGQLSATSAALAQASAERDALSAVASLDVRTVAQRLRDGSVPLRTIAEALSVSEKTIRNWTADVRTNGHAKEA